MDEDASEIGRLFAEAKLLLGATPGAKLKTINAKKERAAVTPIRYFTGRLSGSRNGKAECIRDPDRCHYCQGRFTAGQMRYPLWTVLDNYWLNMGIASVCMPCFKDAPADEATKLERFERECHGCGEPILTHGRGPWRWITCSTRCNQRYHRQRKRQWQGRNCKCCKRWFRGKRKDSLFCSNKCRQSAYRARRP